MITVDPETHEYREDGVLLRDPSVTTVLKAEGFIDTRWFTEYGRIRGSHLHTACHMDDTGVLDEDSVDPALTGFLEAWRRCKMETRVGILESEVSHRDALYGYVGTPDKLVLYRGALEVWDIKTYTPAAWVRLQLAAYARFHEGAGRRTVILNEDGTYQLSGPYVDRMDGRIWLSVLSCYKAKSIYAGGKHGQAV